jgi:hypothetical protein
MIDVKEAAKRAAEYFANLYDHSTYSDLQLEEVELTEDEKYWLITLSYALSQGSTGSLNKVAEILNMPTSGQRKYKQFKIDAENGKVHAMTIRKVS